MAIVKMIIDIIVMLTNSGIFTMVKDFFTWLVSLFKKPSVAPIAVVA
jgi:hypothetical protein